MRILLLACLSLSLTGAHGWFFSKCKKDPLSLDKVTKNSFVTYLNKDAMVDEKVSFNFDEKAQSKSTTPIKTCLTDIKDPIYPLMKAAVAASSEIKGRKEAYEALLKMMLTGEHLFYFDKFLQLNGYKFCDMTQKDGRRCYVEVLKKVWLTNFFLDDKKTVETNSFELIFIGLKADKFYGMNNWMAMCAREERQSINIYGYTDKGSLDKNPDSELAKFKMSWGNVGPVTKAFILNIKLQHLLMYYTICILTEVKGTCKLDIGHEKPLKLNIITVCKDKAYHPIGIEVSV